MKDYTDQLKKYWKTNELSFIATLKKNADDKFGFFTHFVNPVSKLQLFYPSVDEIQIEDKRVSLYYKNVQELVDGEYYKVELEFNSKAIAKNNPYLLQIKSVGKIDQEKVKQVLEQKSKIHSPKEKYDVIACKEHIRQRLERRTKDPDSNKIIANLMREIGKGMYSSKQRVIFELLQNADDSPGKEKVEFHVDFKADYMFVMHDGEEFSPDDVDAITSAAESTKRHDKKKTGYKGIGFKSVFTDSTEVWVKSGGYQFAFLRKSELFEDFESFYFSSSDYKEYPGLIQKRRVEYQNDIKSYNSATDIPWQLIPIWQESLPAEFLESNFNNFNNPVQFAIKVWEKNIKSPDGYLNAIDNILNKPQFILFLRNTSKFRSPKNRTTVVKSGDDNHIVIEKVKIEYKLDKKEQNLIKYNYYKETFSDIEVSTSAFKKHNIEIKKVQKKNDLNEDVFYFTDKEGNEIETIPPKLAASENTEISFGISIFNNKIVAELNYTKGSPHFSSLFTYLPMEDTRFQLPFLVNADFVPSSDRQKIQGDNLWNLYIMIKIAEKHIEVLEICAEKFIEEKVRYGNYLSLLLKRLIPSDDTAQQIINSYNEKYIEKLLNTPIIVNDRNEKQLLSQTILDDSGFTNLFSHDLFYTITNTNKRLPHSELYEEYLKKYVYLKIEILDLKNIALKITPEMCNQIGEEIAKRKLYDNPELFGWLDKLVLCIPNLFGKIPFIVHQNKLFSLDTLIIEEEAWILNSNTIEYKNLFDSLGYHTIDLDLDTYTEIKRFLYEAPNYLNDKTLAFDRISNNSNLSSLDPFTKVKLIEFFKNSKFMNGIGESKYFGELMLFNNENGFSTPLSDLLSRKDNLQIDTLYNFRICQKEFDILPEYIKNKLIQKEEIFTRFILNSEFFHHWTLSFNYNNINTYVSSLIEIYSWKPEDIEISQSQWLGIPWMFFDETSNFIESNDVYWSGAFENISKEYYEILIELLYKSKLKDLPNKFCGELIKHFKLKTDSTPISNWDNIKQIDTNTANIVLDWMEADGNYADFFENFTFELNEGLWDIVELEYFGVVDGSNSELIKYIESIDTLSNKFNILALDLCSEKRYKIGLLQGDMLLNAIIETKLFDQNLAKYIPAKSEWKLIESLISNLSVFKLKTDVEYDSNSPEHILINHILKHVEDLEDIPEEIDSLINQFRDKITINEQSISDFDLSDLIQFGNDHDKKTLKLSDVLPDDFIGKSDILDNIIDSFIAIKNKSKLRKLIFKTRKMSYEEIANRIEENELEYYTVHQIIFQHLFSKENLTFQWTKDEIWGYVADQTELRIKNELIFLDEIYKLKIKDIIYLAVDFVEEKWALQDEIAPSWMLNWMKNDYDKKYVFLNELGFNGNNSPIVKLRKAIINENYNENEVIRFYEEASKNYLRSNTIKWLANFNSEIITKNIKLIKLIYNTSYNNFKNSNKIYIPIINSINRENIRCYNLVYIDVIEEIFVLNNNQDFSFEIFNKLKNEFHNCVIVDDNCDKLLEYYFQNKKEIQLEETADYQKLSDNSILWDEPFYTKWEFYEDYPIYIYDGDEIPFNLKFENIIIHEYTEDMKFDCEGEYFVCSKLKFNVTDHLPSTFPNDILLNLKEWERLTLKDPSLLEDPSYVYEETFDRMIQDRYGLSVEKQNDESSNAKREALYYLKSLGYNVKSGNSDALNYSALFDLIDPNGKNVNCIVRSAKGGLLYIDKEHWDMFESSNTLMFVSYPGNSPRLFKNREELLNEELAKNILFRFKNTKKTADIDTVFRTIKKDSNLILVTSEKMKESLFSKIKTNNSFRTESDSAVGDDYFEID